MTKQKQYIDRTALLRQAETLFDGQREVMGVKAEHIYSAPLEDVAEVVHGEWVKTEKGYKCLQCNCLSALFDKNLQSSFCPWCGAKMDKVSK